MRESPDTSIELGNGAMYSDKYGWSCCPGCAGPVEWYGSPRQQICLDPQTTQCLWPVVTVLEAMK